MLPPILNWILWGGVTVVLGGYLTNRFFLHEDKTVFLPGATTHGHYQIELACNACHEPWGGVREQSCLDCHAAELKDVNDTHPKSKFNDPRNADRLAAISADQCITCHSEHRPEITHPMGVTQPEDFCAHCHQDIAKDRPSHEGMSFVTCSTAGCHNYHDNTALYENFLLAHAHEPAVKPVAQVITREMLLEAVNPPLKAGDHDAPQNAASAHVVDSWLVSAHARAQVNCRDCHAVGPEKQWLDQPGDVSCVSCHQEETAGFMASRHGMRLEQGLPPLQPAMARLPMKAASAHETMSCNTCHSSHDYNTRQAAVNACMQCHNDTHALAYQNSPHHVLWQAETSGAAPPGSGVSCATCHLPRETHTRSGKTVVKVQHNQNLNLRPNEKMARSVCMQCHGLEFTLDALADQTLIQNNFTGRPSVHVESIEMALKRQAGNKKGPKDPQPKDKDSAQ